MVFPHLKKGLAHDCIKLIVRHHKEINIFISFKRIGYRLEFNNKNN